MAAVDLNRGSAGIELTPEQSNEIWADAQETSAVMALAERMELPGAGVSIPVITGDAEASWVGESEEKPVSTPTLDNKHMTGYKLVVTELFSDELLRDAGALYDALVARMPGALAKKFDETVFHATVAPGSNFDLLEGATALTLDGTNTYDDLVAIDAAVNTANGVVNGYALAPKARGVLLGAKDSTGRPLLINNIQGENGIGSLFGAPVRVVRAAYKADAAGDDGEVIGFAGDWTAARYGIVEDISMSINTQGSVTKGGAQINLWQRNMFAVRAEVHLGFVVKDLDKFVKIVSGVNTVS